MAIQINGTDVINNSKNIVNVNDATMTGTVVSKQTAFAYALVSGDGSFADNYNFASCTKISNGRLSFAFTNTPFGVEGHARNYSIFANIVDATSLNLSCRITSRSKSGFEIRTYSGTGAASFTVSVIVFCDATR